jgi:hypothetical protein
MEQGSTLDKAIKGLSKNLAALNTKEFAIPLL